MCRGGHTACAGILQAVRLSEANTMNCATRQRLAAGASDLTKAIVPDGIITRQKEMRKMGTVNFLFTADFLCDKIEKKRRLRYGYVGLPEEAEDAGAIR